MVLNIPGSGFVPSLCRFYLFFFLNLVEEMRSSAFRMSWKRVWILSALFAAIPSLMIWNHIGFLLDDIFFTKWSDERVVQPLFIVGNARSGTTFLHRLLTDADKGKNFTTMRTWEILFAVSVSWKLLFWIIWKIDHVIWVDTLRLVDESFITTLLSVLEKKVLGNATLRSSIHRVGLQQPEEDEWLMMHIALSQLIMLLFPLGGSQLENLIFFDYARKEDAKNGSEASAMYLSSSVRNNIMGYYRQCVQRHLYAKAIKDRLCGRPARVYIFVSKNPPFTMRLHSLQRRFPDARCIIMKRKPIQSIPSMVSYIGSVWAIFATPLVPYPKAEDLIEFCRIHYKYPQDVIGKEWPLEQSYLCNYDDLIKDPLKAVQVLMKSTYAVDITHMLIPLQEERGQQKYYKSTHQYDIMKVCGMSESALKDMMLKRCGVE
eukprot:GSChrysophyteH1.ASY1.ANO1.986.1 assembled CDS